MQTNVVTDTEIKITRKFDTQTIWKFRRKKKYVNVTS